MYLEEVSTTRFAGCTDCFQVIGLIQSAKYKSPHAKSTSVTNALDLLNDKVGGAFAGTINLHEYEAEIDALATTYEELRVAVQKP